MLKDLFGRIAGQAGFQMIAAWRVPNLSYTRRLQLLFNHFGISQVIDIGAYAGQFYDQIRLEVGFKGPIHSFEPDPNLAAALIKRATMDPEWTVSPVALGAANRTMAFNIMENSVYNSFLTPDINQVDHTRNGNTVAKMVDVEIKTLNALVDSFPDLAHTYLKVDTQGFDLEVLKGGREVARQIPALQTEVSVKQLYLGGPSMEDSIRAFTALDFSIADLFLVSTDAHYRALEFDCIMVRDK